MFDRVNAGALGLHCNTVYSVLGTAIPETSKKYFCTAKIKLDGMSGITDSTGTVDVICLGGKYFPVTIADGVGTLGIAISEKTDNSFLGYNFLYRETFLRNAAGEVFPLSFGYRPLVDAGGNVYFTNGFEGGDRWLFRRNFSVVESLFYGSGARFLNSLSVYAVSEKLMALIKEAAHTKDTLAYKALLERISEYKSKATINITSSDNLYSALYYDVCNSTLNASGEGVLWNDGDSLYSHGMKSAGKAIVVPTSFADEKCVGISVINNGDFQNETDGHFLPTPNGVLFMKEVADYKNGIYTAGGEITGHKWGAATDESFDAAGCALSGEFSWLGDLSVLSISDTSLTRKYFSHGGIFLRGGGIGRTIKNFVLPNGDLTGIAGKFVVSEVAGRSFLCDMTTYARFCLRGRIADVAGDVPGGYFQGVSIEEDNDGNAGVFCSVMPRIDENEKTRFVQSIADESVIAPFFARMFNPLNFGWWDFPELGVKGSPPVPSRLGNDEGSDDFAEGTLLNVRRGMSVTADGYIYASGDEDGAFLNIMAWKCDSDGWHSNRRRFQVSDTRVAPYGQGNYTVLHYPGEDWSLFHAPTGFVAYQKLIEETDWSFLLALCGLGGGFALYGALMTQMSFEQYLKDSFGNAMLVSTVPNQHLYRGDVMFSNTESLDNGGSNFWSFVGWCTVEEQIIAVFSVVRGAQGNAPVPEVWGVGKTFFRRLLSGEAGDLEEIAINTIPSTYYPQWGEWPDDSLPPSLTQNIHDILGDTPCLYPLVGKDGSAGGQLAADLMERMDRWSSNALAAGTKPVVSGQLFDHQILGYAVVSPSTPFVDARVEKDSDGIFWILLQHEVGVWISVKCDFDFEPALLEQQRDWELVSLDTQPSGETLAIFGSGVCSNEIGDIDPALATFGFAKYWLRFALYKWYSRYLPIVVQINESEMKKIYDFIKTKES